MFAVTAPEILTEGVVGAPGVTGDIGEFTEPSGRL